MLRSHVRRRPRGVVAVLIVILIFVIGGFVALVMNVGHGMGVRGELQNATDAAALAGAMDLDGTVGGLAPAYEHAVQYLELHKTDVTYINAAYDDVQLGRWDPASRTFAQITAVDATAARQINAVRALAGREASRENPLSVWMGVFLGGVKSMDVRAEAIAVKGGPSICPCPKLPLAFFDCPPMFNRDSSAPLNCGALDTMMSSDPMDNIGFTSLSSGDPASTNIYRQILEGGCISVSEGESINVSNGNQLAPLYQLFLTVMQTSPEFVAPVVHTDVCPPTFNQNHPIIGFATFKLTNLTNDGSTKSLSVEFECDKTTSECAEVGGSAFGTSVQAPRLTR